MLHILSIIDTIQEEHKNIYGNTHKIHNNDDLEGKEKINQERMQRKTTNKAKNKANMLLDICILCEDKLL